MYVFTYVATLGFTVGSGISILCGRKPFGFSLLSLTSYPVYVRFSYGSSTASEIESVCVCTRVRESVRQCVRVRYIYICMYACLLKKGYNLIEPV